MRKDIEFKAEDGTILRGLALAGMLGSRSAFCHLHASE